MQDLKVTIIQSDLHWESPDANRAMFEEKIWKIVDKPDLIVLPEMFTTGFSMKAAMLAEPVNGKTFTWLRQMAQQTKAVITGSVMIKEGGRFFNQLVWMRPDGSFDVYNKAHLFTLAGEDKVYTAGRKKLIVELKGWKICPLICYDLRFPVWSRNIEDYDLLIYVANWPDVRIQAWRSLLVARAIENLSYVVGVNRCGADATRKAHTGYSAIINYEGTTLAEIAENEKIVTMSLSKESLSDFRKRLNFLSDRDSFTIG